MRFDQIEPRADGQLFRVIVETPKGSHHKFAFEPDLKAFVLRKTLPEGMVFPFDFGFIPKTKGEDGDPLDVLLLNDGPLFTGCVAACRIIGLMRAQQKEKGKRTRNDRFVAVADASLEYGDMTEVDDLPPHILKQTEQFFISYNKMSGKEFKVTNVLGAKQSAKILKKALQK